ncbi:MAG: O-antigen ligase family protein [Bacteroidia bacterium]|nr:O-antigen ligase family protein [Bacteroidia bacterium]
MSSTSFSLKSSWFYLLLAGIFPTLSFLFSQSLIDPGLLPRFMTLAALVMTGFASLFVRRREITLNLPPRAFWIAALVYFLAGALSLTVARNLSEAVFELANMALFLLFFFLMLQAMVGEGRFLSWISLGISLAGLVHALIGILQYFELGFSFLPSPEYPASTFVNKNLFSEALLMCLPFSGLLIFGNDKKQKLLAATSVLLCLVAIFLGSSRGVWVGLVGFIFLGGPVIWRAWYAVPPVYLRKKVLIPVYLLAFMVVLGLGFFKIPGKDVGQKWTWITQKGKNMEDNMSSVEERLILWNYSVELAQKHPFLGVGLRNWKVEILQYGVKGYVTQYATKYFKRPHNDYLWVLTETGPSGLLGYLGLLLLPLWLALQVIRGSSSRQDRLAAAILAAGMVAYLLISCFGFPKERVFIHGLMWVISAGILGLHLRLKPAKGGKISGKGLLILPVFVLLAGISFFISFKRSQSETHIAKMLTARSTQNWQGVIRESDKGKSWWNNLETVSGTPIAWYRGVAAFSLGKNAEAANDFREARKIHPWHPHVMNNEATSYEVAGEHEKAIQLYLETLALYPDFEDVYLNLAAVYFNLGRNEDALQTLCGFEPHSKKRERKQYLDVVKSKMGMGEKENPCDIP